MNVHASLNFAARCVPLIETQLGALAALTPRSLFQKLLGVFCIPPVESSKYPVTRRKLTSAPAKLAYGHWNIPVPNS